MARLVCLAGPQAGSEYVLEGDEMVIGRAADNAISIPDTSVSRKHVLMRQTPDGWAASDMGSGNGTLVNNGAISEETVLGDGDVITLGDTELKFVSGAPAASAAIERRAPVRRGGGEAPPRASRPIVRSSRRTAIADDPRLKARRRTLFIRLGAVAVVLLAGGVGYKTYQKKIDQALESKAAKKQRKIDHEQALFQEGKNLVRQGKWTEAKAKFEEVLASGPENPKDVQTYLTRAETEIPNQEHFTAGMAAIEAGQIAVAFKELGLVSNDTLQTEQRDKLRAAIEKKIESKLGDVRLLLGSTSDRAKMVQLKELAEDVLAARPENRDATDYKKTAEKAIDAIDHPYVAPKEAPKPWLHVQDVYRGGDVTGAYSEAQRCEKESNQCKQLAGQIRDMNEKYKRLESMGPGELSSLLDLDHKITGGPSSEIGRRIGTRANASYIKTASSAKATGNWARAAEYAKKVLSNDPNNVEAQSIMNECNNHAREIYMRAYSIKDSDPDEAVKLFKQVVEMTPPDSEYNTKAKARLSRNTSD